MANLHWYHFFGHNRVTLVAIEESLCSFGKGASPVPLQFKTTPVRSENMRAIKDRRNRTTEMRFRAYMVTLGIRGWQVRPGNLVGSPDFVFPRHKVTIFVDGCFWHGCPKCGHIPKTNKPYWRTKIARNRARDARTTRRLRRLGFSVVRLWECDLRKRPSTCVRRIERALKRTRARR